MPCYLIYLNKYRSLNDILYFMPHARALLRDLTHQYLPLAVSTLTTTTSRQSVVSECFWCALRHFEGTSEAEAELCKKARWLKSQFGVDYRSPWWYCAAHHQRGFIKDRIMKDDISSVASASNLVPLFFSVGFLHGFGSLPALGICGHGGCVEGHVKDLLICGSQGKKISAKTLRHSMFRTWQIPSFRVLQGAAAFSARWLVVAALKFSSAVGETASLGRGWPVFGIHMPSLLPSAFWCISIYFQGFTGISLSIAFGLGLTGIRRCDLMFLTVQILDTLHPFACPVYCCMCLFQDALSSAKICPQVIVHVLMKMKLHFHSLLFTHYSISLMYMQYYADFMISCNVSLCVCCCTPKPKVS